MIQKNRKTIYDIFYELMTMPTLMDDKKDSTI